MFVIVKTFTTVGYGSVRVETNEEMVFIMIVEFLGIVLFGYLIG